MQRILIVDDQHDVRHVLRAGLATLGKDIHVTDVPSGEEAMLVLANQAFDLLIVDVRLPGISGLELRAWAQVKNPQLKLIIITGTTEPKVRQQVMDAPVDAYFFKPIEMSEFLTSAEILLGRRLPSHTGDDHGRESKPSVGGRQVPAPETKNPQPEAREELLIHEKTKPAGNRHPAEPPLIHQRRSPAAAEPDGLVFSTYDPEKKRQQAMFPETMSTRLSRFRTEMDAISVIILDESGQVVARAGVLPNAKLENDLLATLVVSIRASAKAASLLGQPKPDSFLALRGSEYDLFLAPIGASWGLMAAVPPQEAGAPETLAQVAELVRDAAESLLSILGAKHIPPASEDLSTAAQGMPAAPEPESQPLLPDLEDLFDSAQIKTKDAHEFWETALDEDAVNPQRADTISYERALGLGLTSENPEE